MKKVMATGDFLIYLFKKKIWSFWFISLKLTINKKWWFFYVEGYNG